MKEEKQMEAVPTGVWSNIQVRKDTHNNSTGESFFIALNASGLYFSWRSDKMFGENGAVATRTVGREEWQKTKKVLVLKLLSLRCLADIHVESGNTIWKYNHGVISVETMFKAMRLKSPKKYV